MIDPAAVRVLPWMLRRPWVTPFRLTCVAALCGIGSTVCFALGQLVAGALLFELRFFVDCLDGKLARVQQTSSPRGAFFDFGCDVVLIGSNTAAIGWYLVDRHSVPATIPLIAVVAVLVTFWVILFDSTARRQLPGDEQPWKPGRVHAVRRFFDTHRLARAPRTVEVETLVLFIAPLTGSPGLMQGALAAASIFYAAVTARLAVLVYRRLPPDQPIPDQPPGG